MSDSIKTKLSAARTRLILERPFLGALVLRLPMIDATSWCRTTATDARSFFYNREYIETLSLEQTQFMLAHDALHCALLHFMRRHHRDKHRWDIACDFAVNPLLVNDGLKPPPDVLYLKEYEGMTAEEIYPMLNDQLDQEPTDQHLYDQDAGNDNARSDESGLDEKVSTGGGINSRAGMKTVMHHPVIRICRKVPATGSNRSLAAGHRHHSMRVTKKTSLCSGSNVWRELHRRPCNPASWVVTWRGWWITYCDHNCHGACCLPAT